MLYKVNAETLLTHLILYYRRAVCTVLCSFLNIQGLMKVIYGCLLRPFVLLIWMFFLWCYSTLKYIVYKILCCKEGLVAGLLKVNLKLNWKMYAVDQSADYGGVSFPEGCQN